MIAMSCAGVLLAGVTSGCFISRKETVREPHSRDTTIERRSTVETVPGDTDVRTRTTIERDY